jgi:hypothetical protein
VRALYDDSGLTAVEYAALSGLVIAICGAAAFWLGQGVNKSSGRISWGKGSASSLHASHIPAAGPHPQLATPAAERSSTFSLALMSLGITLVGIVGFVGWHYFRDTIRQGRTRRRVRQSLTGSTGQAALERLVRKSSRDPIARIKRPDTSLIGRNGPDVHHWVKGQDVSLSGELASSGSRFVRPETEIEIMARLRPLASRQSAIPSPPPGMPVVG